MVFDTFMNKTLHRTHGIEQHWIPGQDKNTQDLYQILLWIHTGLHRILLFYKTGSSTGFQSRAGVWDKFLLGMSHLLHVNYYFDMQAWEFSENFLNFRKFCAPFCWFSGCFKTVLSIFTHFQEMFLKLPGW